MSGIVELFGLPTSITDREVWKDAVASQHCPYLGKKCIKVRKSQSEISIGTCTVDYRRDPVPIVICPFRLLERKQVFTDALHLLTLHEPGNELHVVPEMSIPGGSVDYFLVSVRGGSVVDFVGIELQTLDTTGTVWPERQRFIQGVGLSVKGEVIDPDKSYGMNWKMTAKTILVQLHHKVETFEHLSKHLVLALQDHLMAYMQREFTFGHMNCPARLGDATHIHAYSLVPETTGHRIQLTRRASTDGAGIATALGLQAVARVELDVVLADIQRKLSDKTRWNPV